MDIVTTRRISQVFFFALFLWFCVVTTFGAQWWQLRGWPVNWFLQLDPLVAVATALTTGTVYAGLLWALVTVVLTLCLGRFFCGWVCPFGSMHQFAGYLAWQAKPLSERLAANKYHRYQNLKYYLLLFLLSAAAGALLARLTRSALSSPPGLWLVGAATVTAAALAARRAIGNRGKAAVVLTVLLAVWTALCLLFSVERLIGASLQTGLLDPIPLVYRSVNLVLLPIADAAPGLLSAGQRHYEGAWFIGFIFFGALLLNLKSPRFYCRFICPLGALQGILAPLAPWRIGKREETCTQCGVCEAGCEGACEPAKSIRLTECVLCMNCLNICRNSLIDYRAWPSTSSEVLSPEISRRGFITTMAAGIAIVPMVRLGGQSGPNWNSTVIRPPGALSEGDFLARCIKCGQCMRICPTNVIHPSALEGGIEGLWTPQLNFRIGTSGCQLNCIACAHVCPTAALRPISLDEKLGRGAFTKVGPIRLGTAFLDRGRCLPWAMDRPCIVCQENCPVSPKALYVKEAFNTIRGGLVTVEGASGLEVRIKEPLHRSEPIQSGDYFLKVGLESEKHRFQIVGHSGNILELAPGRPLQAPLPPGSKLEIQVRLQLPYVDPERCTGCGVCEHECPVSGRRAIRVTAENESRNRKHSLLVGARI